MIAFFRSPKAIYYFLGIAIFVRILNDAYFGRYQIHESTLWPARFSGFLPLGNVPMLLFEWSTLFIIASMLFIESPRVRTWASRVGCLILLFSLSQFFQNQKLYIFFAPLALSYSPRDLTESANLPLSPEQRSRLFLTNHSRAIINLRFLIVVAYFSAAIHKLSNGFYNGEALSHTLHTVTQMSPYLPAWDFRPFLAQQILELNFSKLLSTLTIFLQLSIPLLLWKMPIIGFAFACSFHLCLSAFMPDILPFGIAMVATALSFLTVNEPSAEIKNPA